jgi:WD40 repeat protein
VLATNDGAIERWNHETREAGSTITGLWRDCDRLAFSSDCRVLAAARGSQVTLRNVWNGVVRRVIRLADSPVSAMTFPPNGQLLVSGFRNGLIQVFHDRTGGRRLSLTGHRGTVNALAFSPDGQLFASALTDRTLRIWITKTSGTCNRLRARRSKVGPVMFSPHGQTLASCLDFSVELLDVRTARLRCTLRAPAHHYLYRQPILFSSDSQTVATMFYGYAT